MYTPVKPPLVYVEVKVMVCHWLATMLTLGPCTPLILPLMVWAKLVRALNERVYVLPSMATIDDKEARLIATAVPEIPKMYRRILPAVGSLNLCGVPVSAPERE
jgi:hypothetical protein